jgi:hypothetical protein
MRVKRVSYIKKNGVVKRLRKTVIKVVEPDAYISYNYHWSESLGKWMPLKGVAYFDGIDCVEAGVLHLKENAERYAELLTKYSGFENMAPGEDNVDTHKEDEYLNSILNSADALLMQ